jgi:hypothetical protein
MARNWNYIVRENFSWVKHKSSGSSIDCHFPLFCCMHIKEISQISSGQGLWINTSERRGDGCIVPIPCTYVISLRERESEREKVGYYKYCSHPALSFIYVVVTAGKRQCGYILKLQKVIEKLVHEITFRPNNQQCVDMCRMSDKNSFRVTHVTLLERSCLELIGEY